MNALRRILYSLLSATLLIAGCAACASPAETTPDSAPAPDAGTDGAENETASDEAVSAGKLSDPDADECARLTYEYLCSNFGSAMISCQQESTWRGSPDYEMDYIYGVTGKYPAMRGLDFMNNDFDGVVERAEAWHEKGGLVTICWHTGVYGSGYRESLDDDPDYDKLLTEGTEEYDGMIASWDRAAEALSRLRDDGICVLWRPFHEFDGQWFWWGKGGADNFIRLWRLMYDYFTGEKQLHNLIWVLGYSGDVKDGWYPGDEYCDVIGSDTYDNSTNLKAWERLEALGTGKPMAFHECGNVPSVDSFEADGDLWSWFMVWHTDHIIWNDRENLSNVYNSDRVITLDELSLPSPADK
jgi:mannan endo-1,4-beta-mannosidase